MNPIKTFIHWYEEELIRSSLSIPSACCLSTIGLDGYPNARFVSLKDVKEGAFIVTGPLNSRKGIEIARNNQVALTFWWTNTERQVRIQGEAVEIEASLAEAYFKKRNRQAKIVSTLSRQGQVAENLNQLVAQFQEMETSFNGKEIERPADWGGYAIHPIRIELMTFKATRFHERRLFFRKEESWVEQMLQP